MEFGQYVRVAICLAGVHARSYLHICLSFQGVAPYLISPLMGIQDAGVTSSWAFGCDVACSDSGGFAEAVTIAKGADVVIVVMGLDHGQERWDPG